MLKKSLAIILSIALALGIMVQGSFAFTYDNSGTQYSFDDLWALGIPTSSSLLTTYNNAYDYLKDSITVDSEMFIGVHNWNVTFYGLIIYCSESGYFRFYNNRLYLSEPNTHVYYVNGATNQSYNTGSMVSNTAGTVIDGEDYYLVTSYVNVSDLNASSLYSSSEIYYFNNLLSPKNLEFGSLNPDTRVLDVYKYEYAYLPYLAIRTDDVPTSPNSWVSIRYHDIFPDGTSHIGTAIFDYADYSDMILYGDDFDTILISPLDISPYQLFVQSVLFSGSTSWGFKELELENSIAFNPALYPSPIPSVTPVPDYFYYDTTYINYNGGNKDAFFNSYSVVIDLYGTDSGGLVSNPYYFTDSDGYLEQPFAYSFIMLPSYISSSGYTYDGFIDDSFVQYDIILDKVPNSFWITSYGGSAYSDLQSGLSNFSSGDDVSLFLENFFSSHPPAIYTYPYGNEELSFIDHFNCILTITDSFYFKQTNYLLGDSGDILSEFSERFFKLNGFSDSLFSNLSALYNLDLLFYNDVSDSLTELSYRLNSFDFNDSFNSVISYLSSLDSYISSVDSKLNYLSTIDSDLNDLLEWFQNQDDSDVVLTLPDFNSTILIDLYGQNVGDLVDFFNDFVVVLPSFDFSDFPNFFTKSNDIVTDVADNNDDIIDNLFQPYDYSDDGLSTFGWD